MRSVLMASGMASQERAYLAPPDFDPDWMPLRETNFNPIAGRKPINLTSRLPDTPRVVRRMMPCQRY